jgi:predicted DNA-binding transcriptional regulator YafY
MQSSAVASAELERGRSMPDTRHEAEAEKILSALNSSLPDDQSRRLLAEALATAERRGRQISGREKESSG